MLSVCRTEIAFGLINLRATGIVWMVLMEEIEGELISRSMLMK